MGNHRNGRVESLTSPTPKSVITPSGLLYFSGALLVLSGVIHVGVWLVLGGDWEGSISWRKPILFGLSTGMTVLSIAWVYPKLRAWKWDLFLFGSFGLAMVAEVALITMQQWRGEASHFNHTSPLNALVENWMTYLIVFATLVLVDFTRRCFLSLDAPSDLKLAIRGGMTFLIVSCLIGFAILFYGQSRTSLGADPSTIGQAGVAKFPHGIAIHAIQLFPLLCWLMWKLGIPLNQRFQMTVLCLASTGTFLIFSLFQTLNGKSRFDLDPVGQILLLVAALLLLPVAVSILYRWIRQLIIPVEALKDCS
jgi:hypothetical protein